ncbi:MAG: hypothetical protein Q8Q06_01840 [bacterium]|nr:hypothetical protein [bacterium]
MNLNFQNNSSNKTEKFMKFLIAVLIVTAFSLGGYIWTKKGGLQTASLLENSLISRFTGDAEEKLSPDLKLARITSEDSRFAVLSEDGKNVIYYVPSSGEIKSVPINGSGNSINVAVVDKLAENITWSKNRKELILTRNSRSKYFNLSSGLAKELPVNALYPAFSQFENRISYVSFNNEEGSGHINVADPKIEGFKELVPTRSSYWLSGWVKESIVYLHKPDLRYYELSTVYTLDIQTGKLAPIVELDKHLSFEWSPTGNKILYSSEDPGDGKLKLHVNELLSGNISNLDLETSASKCSWGNNEETIYCSKPGPGGDTFYMVTLSSKDGPQKIITPDENTDATELVLTSSGDYLIFRNLNNNRLYSLLLK